MNPQQGVESMAEVECPIEGCDYSNEPSSVQAHISASPGNGHGGKSGFQYQEELAQKAEQAEAEQGQQALMMAPEEPAEPADEPAEATNLEAMNLEEQAPEEEPADEPAGEAGEEMRPDDVEPEVHQVDVDGEEEPDDDQEGGEDGEQPAIADEETADFEAVDEDAPVPTHHEHSDEGPAKPVPEDVDVDELTQDGDDAADELEDAAEDEVAEAVEVTEEEQAGIPIPVSAPVLFALVALLAIAALWMSMDQGGSDGGGDDGADREGRGLIDL